jgi:hypothetical protein
MILEFKYLITNLKTKYYCIPDGIDHIIMERACKAAIKFGEKLSDK